MEGIPASLNGGGRKAHVTALSDDGKETKFTVKVRVDTPQEMEYYRNGRHPPLRLAPVSRQVKSVPS